MIDNLPRVSNLLTEEKWIKTQSNKQHFKNMFDCSLYKSTVLQERGSTKKNIKGSILTHTNSNKNKSKL